MQFSRMEHNLLIWSGFKRSLELMFMLYVSLTQNKSCLVLKKLSCLLEFVCRDKNL